MKVSILFLLLTRKYAKLKPYCILEIMATLTDFVTIDVCFFFRLTQLIWSDENFTASLTCLHCTCMFI